MPKNLFPHTTRALEQRSRRQTHIELPPLFDREWVDSDGVEKSHSHCVAAMNLYSQNEFRRNGRVWRLETGCPLIQSAQSYIYILYLKLNERNRCSNDGCRQRRCHCFLFLLNWLTVCPSAEVDCSSEKLYSVVLDDFEHHLYRVCMCLCICQFAKPLNRLRYGEDWPSVRAFDIHAQLRTDWKWKFVARIQN